MTRSGIVPSLSTWRGWRKPLDRSELHERVVSLNSTKLGSRKAFYMLQPRRGFLIGVGSLLTAAFVKDARSFIRTSGRPLLARPKQVAQTMYWYESGDQGYLLTLGKWTHEPPPAPSWRELPAT